MRNVSHCVKSINWVCKGMRENTTGGRQKNGRVRRSFETGTVDLSRRRGECLGAASQDLFPSLHRQFLPYHSCSPLAQHRSKYHHKPFILLPSHSIALKIITSPSYYHLKPLQRLILLQWTPAPSTVRSQLPCPTP